MINNLKQTLRELRAKRLIDYGNTAYQHISNDWNFKYVPTELRELWYSFMAPSMSYISVIDHMSHDELIHWIDIEKSLINRLEVIFSKIQK